jgi:hypothetical protein
MKLRTKHRAGSKVTCTYYEARTPLQRLLESQALAKDVQKRLEGLFHALDPVRLLRQVEMLQEALWQHAVLSAITAPESLGTVRASTAEIRFNVHGCGLPPADTIGITAGSDTATAASASPSIAELAALLAVPGATHSTKRKYWRTKISAVRTWRTRTDPFAAIWDEVRQRLEAAPERTAEAIFQEIQQAYPGQYTDGQLRTLQRQVKAWRAQAILQFDHRCLDEEPLATQALPAALHAQTIYPCKPAASAG